MSDNANEMRKQWARIVAKAWADEAYKSRLLTDPVTVLEEEGMALPQGVKVRVMEDSEKLRTLVIPWPPMEGEDIENLEERLAASFCVDFF